MKTKNKWSSSFVVNPAIEIFSSPFQSRRPNVANNRRLREPQREAHKIVAEHFSSNNRSAIIQIPVGCGKTGLMGILPFGIATGRTLIIAPNTTIRDAIFKDVDSASRSCFWRQLGVAKATHVGPFAAKIDGPDSTIQDCEDSHFVVTNIQQLAGSENRWLKNLPNEFFDMILIDEGHHNAAKSWQRVINHFHTAKIVSLTATPFRADKKKLTGEIIYRYSFLRAMRRGYIKRLRAQHVAPCELSFVFKDNPQRCSLDEILKLREENWFSNGVALAPECNRHIVAASIDACEKLRRINGTKHQIIAAACSVEHSSQIAELFRNQGYVAEAIHSGLNKATQANILKRLKRGDLDVIVQVQMLGEGFDHPALSVAAIFRPFRSLPPYIQFVGRIMRVIDQKNAGSGDNQGVLISHVGLNTERHWDEFRQLDSADQELWVGLIRGIEDPTKRGDDQANAPKSFAPEMLVEWERLSGLEQAEFGTETIVENLGSALPNNIVIEGPLYAGPQQRRRETNATLRSNVDQAIRSIHRQLNLDPMGRQVGRVMRRMKHMRNWATVRYLVYWKLNELAGRTPSPSKLWTLSETEQAIEVLPHVTAALVQFLRRRLDDSHVRYGQRNRSFRRVL